MFSRADIPAALGREARAIAAYSAENGPLAFALSCGRDSAVMLDVMASLLPDISAHSFFTWSYYPEVLPYKARYLAAVERRYGIRVETHLDPTRAKGKQADFVKGFMESHGCRLCLFGHHMDESLQRRGLLKSLADGIDPKNGWAYPLRSFTKPKVRAWAKNRRLPLSPEYGMGLAHDFHEHRGNAAHFLRHYIGEADYQAAIRQDPNIEVDYVRALRDPKVKALAASDPLFQRRAADG